MVYVPTTYHILSSSCHFYASSLYLCITFEKNGDWQELFAANI